MQKVAIILGTRPEAIKLLPVYFELLKRNVKDISVVSTGQHREMLYQVLDIFNVQPAVDLNVMKDGQGLDELTGNIFIKLGNWVKENNPGLIIVQGDTTTAMVAAVVGFYNNIAIAHVEAGLRTYNKKSPFPEEINRQFIGAVSDYHFAPTQKSYDVLLRERREKVYLVGNTVIDSLFSCLKLIKDNNTFRDKFKTVLRGDRKNILVTCHRRESFRQGIKNICEAVKILSIDYQDLNFVFPVHLNPQVSSIVNSNLQKINNVKLLPPLQYDEMVYVMSNSLLVLTDSGGIQEEAPSLNIPVLVLRETTEREEGIENGCSKLVGTGIGNITSQVRLLLENKVEYQKMANAPNPYGDGKAAKRIVDCLLREI